MRKSPSNSNSPISSGDSSSAASEGRLSELRDIFMSAIEKDREKRVEERLRMEKEVEEKTRFDAEMDPEKRGRVDSWRKVFGGGSDTARPSWRDRSRQKHQESPSSGGFRGNRSHWDIADERQGKAESESERISFKYGEFLLEFLSILFIYSSFIALTRSGLIISSKLSF